MDSDRKKYLEDIEQHYVRLWGAIEERFTPEASRENEFLPGFSICAFSPNQKHDFWRYATVGMSDHRAAHPLELHLFARENNPRMAELLTMVSHFHLSGSRLGLSHIVNFGEPWLDSSLCTWGFISLPYLDGPHFEWLNRGDHGVRFLWLIPITEAERNYLKQKGVEAFEEKLEEADFDYLDPARECVIPKEIH